MISGEQLQSIGGWLQGQMLDEQVAMRLRERYPELHFTYCMDDDVMVPTPAYADERFNLYLVGGTSGHCLAFTSDPHSATGVVVAEIDEDEAA